MDKTFALFMTALLLLSGCLGADENSVSDAIILAGCNDATALNYDANNSAAESVNTTAFCASEEALEQGIMEFIQFMDEGPEDNITTTIGYSMEVSEVSEDNMTWTYLETALMTPTGMKTTTMDNYGEDFGTQEIIMSGNQIQYSTSTSESNMTVRMTHAHGFRELIEMMEDDGMEDDGMEDDGMEDDDMEDDDMDDDDMGGDDMNGDNMEIMWGCIEFVNYSLAPSDGNLTGVILDNGLDFSMCGTTVGETNHTFGTGESTMPEKIAYRECMTSSVDQSTECEAGVLELNSTGAWNHFYVSEESECDDGNFDSSTNMCAVWMGEISMYDSEAFEIVGQGESITVMYQYNSTTQSGILMTKDGPEHDDDMNGHDDDMEDDGMEEGEEVDPAPEDYTPYFTTNATFEDFSITEAGMSFTGLLNVAGAPFGELVVYTTTDFAVTGFTLVDVNEANNYVKFSLINSGEAVVDETIALSALPFLLMNEEMMSMLGVDMGDGGDDNNGDDQFMCDDGELIDADWVNDGEEDCADGSDEFDDNDGNNNGQTDSWSFDRDVAACDEDNDSMVDYQEFINCIENDLTNDGYGSMNADDVGADMMFEIGDMDNNSLLNESELSYINQMINGDDGNNNDEAPSPEEAMNASDADGNGAVSWSEFTAEWNSNWAESGNLSDDSGFESQLFSAFNDSDMDNSGDLNLTELELFIDEVDMIMNTDYSNASTPEEMFSMFDLDGNSQINVSELFIGLDPNDTMSQEDQYNIDSMYNMYVGDNSEGLNMTEFTSLWDEMNSDDNGDDNGDDNDNGGDNGDDNGGEGTDEDTGDSETLYIMGFFPAEGVLDDYSLVLANCVMSEQSMTPESCEEGVYSVVLSSIVMDGNSTSNPGVMFMDTDASGTLSSGDMIIIDHSELNLTEEWNTPRLHSEEANAYADENPMMPGFTGILATLGLLGAALSRRE